MAGDCLTRLLDPEVKKKLFGDRDIPDSLAKKFVADIEEIKKNYDANPEGENYNSRVNTYIRDQRELSAIELKAKALNLKKTNQRMARYMSEGFAKDPIEAFHSMLDKTVLRANDGNYSVVSQSTARLDRYNDHLFGAIEEKGLNKIFTSGEIDKDIMVAWEMKKKGLPVPEGISKEAQEIAEVLNRHQEVMLKDQREVGAPVRNLENRLGPQSHDIEKIKASGKEQWIANTLPQIDQKATFGVFAGNEEAMNRILGRTYQEIVAGKYGLSNQLASAEVADFEINGGEKAIGDRLSEARTLHFKGGEAQYNYTTQYGKGNLAANLFDEIRVKSRQIALMDMFGDKPKAALEADFNRVADRLSKSGRIDDAEKLMSQKKRIEGMFNEIATVDRNPANGTLAKVAGMNRSLQAAAKLGGIGLRSVANLAGSAVELRNATGQNILMTYAKNVGAWLSSLPEGFRETYTSHTTNFMNDMQAATLDNMVGGRVGPGLAKVAMLVNKYNGQDLVNNVTKFATTNFIQSALAENVAKDFGELHPQLQATLLENGFDKHDWSLMKHAVETTEDGARSFLTPEGIQNISLDEARGALQAKGSRQAVSKYLNDMDLKLRSAVIQASNIATTTAGFRERSALTFNTDRGTAPGEFLRTLLQFKSFTLQSMNIGKRFLNSNPDMESLASGVLKTRDRQMGDVKGLAQWLVGATLLGYATDTALRGLNGDPPRNWHDPKTWIDAVGKAGVGGLYADMVTGEWNKYSWAASFGGPTVSNTSDALAIAAQMKDNYLSKNPEQKVFDKNVGVKSTRLIRNNIPFQSFPVLKRGFDYLQNDVINEHLSPGFNERRAARRAEKQ